MSSFTNVREINNLLLIFGKHLISLLRELMIPNGAIEVRSRIYKLVLTDRSIHNLHVEAIYHEGAIFTGMQPMGICASIPIFCKNCRSARMLLPYDSSK